MDLKLFFRCLFSPSLYYIHRGSQSNVGKYDRNEWEKRGDKFITSFIFFRALTVYTSPLLIFVMARKGFLTFGGALYLAKISLGIGVLVGASYCVRCYGRIYNPKYTEFIDDLDTAVADYNNENKQKLRNYDFEFSAWPVDHEFKRRGRPAAKRSWSSILSPCGLISYVVIHTIGIRLIYPGSIPFVNFLMGPYLEDGRHNLVANERGQRYKLKTEDGNFIDTMFIDRRNDRTKENGNTLVVCSEGNAGFYEIGIMATPIEGQYSVLGWNHPGFGGSTGLPYIDQEENAVDTVMQFALNILGFKPENIILFGWSIGGFSTAYAAMNYPDVKAVVVDASFDDLMPLATSRMPLLLEPIVKQSIRLQANLDVSRKLSYYPGPLLLIRRTKDEVICLEPDDLSTNRGNHMVLNLLSSRYPNLISEFTNNALFEWLSVTGKNQTDVAIKYHVNDNRCMQILSSYYSLNDQSFPSQIGDGLDQDLKTQLLLYLASKYFLDFDATHCTILPLDQFKIPSLPSGQ